MPTTLVISSPIQVFFYYVFHIIFLGHPADILARLWLAYDLSREYDDEDNARRAWLNFEESIRESYKTVGVLAGLVAATTSLFFSVNTDIANTTVRTLFLASITTAVLSAASSFGLLSTVLPEPIALEKRWEESGLGFILGLAAPSAWLSLSLWTFQGALLALVWITDETPARIVVTTLIGLRLLLKVVVATSATGFREFCQGLLGWRYGADHRMIRLTAASIKLRDIYLEECNAIYEGECIRQMTSRPSSFTSDGKPKRKKVTESGTLVPSMPPMQRTESPEPLPRSERRSIKVSSRAVRHARLFVSMPDEEVALQSATLTVAATAAATATAAVAFEAERTLNVANA